MGQAQILPLLFYHYTSQIPTIIKNELSNLKAGSFEYIVFNATSAVFLLFYTPILLIKSVYLHISNTN